MAVTSAPDRLAAQSEQAERTVAPRSAPLAGFSGTRRVPPPTNDPIKSYAPGSPERKELKSRLSAMANERVDVPIIIGGREIRTGRSAHAVMPHNHRHVLADWHKASIEHVNQAVDAAREARAEWGNWAWEDRAAVFLRAGELLATTWRSTLFIIAHGKIPAMTGENIGSLAAPTVSGAHPKPVRPSDRIDALDVLRGLALFGVLAVNIVTVFRVSIFAQFLPNASPAGLLDRAMAAVLTVAVDFKALALFSMLFGVGLAIQFGRLAGRQQQHPRTVQHPDLMVAQFLWQTAVSIRGGFDLRAPQQEVPITACAGNELRRI